MDDEKKKMVKVVVIIGCLVLAGAITFLTREGGGSGGDAQSRKTWITCRNPKCKAEYQISMKKYNEAMEENDTQKALLMMMEVPAIICQECNEKSAYQAEKCEKCGLVFEQDFKSIDYADRCPKCKFSKMESEIGAAK